jgi:hypothetical protein
MRTLGSNQGSYGRRIRRYFLWRPQPDLNRLCRPPGVSGNSTGQPKGALNKLSLAVGGGLLGVKRQEGLEKAPLQETVKCDFRRPHTHTAHKIGGVWRRTVEQDGQIFDRDTGVEIILSSATP